MPGMEIYLEQQQAEVYDDFEYPLSYALDEDPDNNWHLSYDTPDDDYIETPFVTPKRSVRGSRS